MASLQIKQIHGLCSADGWFRLNEEEEGKYYATRICCFVALSGDWGDNGGYEMIFGVDSHEDGMFPVEEGHVVHKNDIKAWLDNFDAELTNKFPIE